MKILCVSDQIDPLVYSNSVKERFSDVEFVFCAGDLPMEYIDFIVSSLNLPTYFVFGNHNLNEFHLFHKSFGAFDNTINNLGLDSVSGGANYAGFKALTIPTSVPGRPLLVVGASGSIKYNKGLCQYSDNAMKLKLLRLLPRLLYNKLRYGRYLDIFLTHSPPRHLQDKEDPCHRGFTCFRWFLEKFKPQYMLHGHIHLYDLQESRITKYHQTEIINVFSHYILDIPWSSHKDGL